MLTDLLHAGCLAIEVLHKTVGQLVDVVTLPDLKLDAIVLQIHVQSHEDVFGGSAVFLVVEGVRVLVKVLNLKFLLQTVANRVVDFAQRGILVG